MAPKNRMMINFYDLSSITMCGHNPYVADDKLVEKHGLKDNLYNKIACDKIS